MIKNYIKKWKKKSVFSKITDFIFIALVITLLFPQGRLAIGGFVNRIKASISQPDLMKVTQTTTDAAFDWQMKTTSGDDFDFSSVKGKVVFLNLWATWCPPCVGEMPSIQKLYDKYADHPEVAFVMVSNESPDIIKAFKDKKGYTFPVYSSLSETPAAFFTRSIPTTYVIDKEGKIVVREVGAMNWGGKKMEKILQELIVK